MFAPNFLHMKSCKVRIIGRLERDLPADSRLQVLNINSKSMFYADESSGYIVVDMADTAKNSMLQHLVSNRTISVDDVNFPKEMTALKEFIARPDDRDPTVSTSKAIEALKAFIAGRDYRHTEATGKLILSIDDLKFDYTIDGDASMDRAFHSITRKLDLIKYNMSKKTSDHMQKKMVDTAMVTSVTALVPAALTVKI